MNTNTIKYQALKFLLQIGQIRTSSLSAWLFYKQEDTHNVSTTIKGLIKDDLLEKKTYRIKRNNNHRSGTEDVYRLTAKGKALVADTEEDPYYSENYKSFEKEFLTRQPDEIPEETDRIKTALLDSDIISMMSACSVPAFRHDKPSIMYIRDVISGTTPEPEDGYLDYLSKEECKGLLEKGIYYTMQEFRTFADCCAADLSQTFSGTKARGIFISDKTCYIIYITERYNNKLAKLNRASERGLLVATEHLDHWTNIRRPSPDFDEYRLDDSGNYRIRSRFSTKPYAIIFSDGDMLAYSIATGNAKGKIKKRDLAKETAKKEKRPDESVAKNKNTTLLSAASSLYERMYVIPETSNGLTSLNYLLTRSLEDWREEGCYYIEQSPLFTKEEGAKELFPYRCKAGTRKLAVTYMPVIEAKTLYDIAVSNKNPVFLTYKDNLNVIAHSIRKEGRYCDIETGEMFDRDACLIYGASGNIKGMSVLDEYVHSIGLDYDKRTESHALPKAFGMEFNAFYNALAREELSPEKAAEKLNTRPYIEKTKYYSKRMILSCSLSKVLCENVKARAKEEGISASRLVTKALQEYLKEK